MHPQVAMQSASGKNGQLPIRQGLTQRSRAEAVGADSKVGGLASTQPLQAPHLALITGSAPLLRRNCTALDTTIHSRRQIDTDTVKNSSSSTEFFFSSLSLSLSRLCVAEGDRKGLRRQGRERHGRYKQDERFPDWEVDPAGSSTDCGDELHQFAGRRQSAVHILDALVKPNCRGDTNNEMPARNRCDA